MTSFLFSAIVLGLFAFTTGKWVIDRRPVDPSTWKRDIQQEKLIRFVKNFLRANGWEIKPPWDWYGVWVRARKDGCDLNLIIYDGQASRIKTVMLDTLDATAKESHIFGILTFEEIERDLEQDAMRGDLFIVKPTDLISVESRVQFVIDRRQKRLTERNHTKDAPMVDVAGDPATGL